MNFRILWVEILSKPINTIQVKIALRVIAIQFLRIAKPIAKPDCLATTSPRVACPPGFTSLIYEQPSNLLYNQYVRQPSYDELFLPRPEFKKFDGNPLEFNSFLINFETHVKPRVHDKKMLLCLLLQHGEASVKERIEYFSEKGNSAYKLAKAKLLTEYGQPCIIANICEQKLKNPRKLKAVTQLAFKVFLTF